MSMTKPTCRVRAVHCHHQASDQEIYAALKRATEPLQEAWSRLKAARRIAIKFNQDWPPQNLAFLGRNPEQAMWLKYVDPQEREGEQYQVYEQALAQIREL